MDDYSRFYNLDYATGLPTEALKRFGITDPSQIGVRYTTVADPTAGEGAAPSMQVPQFYNKVTGDLIGTDGYGSLGAGPSLGVDKSGNVIGLNPVKDEGFFGGLLGRTKDILSNDAVQMVLAAYGAGNLAAGALGGAGAGAGYGVSAEAAMNDLLQQEIASGGINDLANLPAANPADFGATTEAAGAGTYGPSAESAMADLATTEAAAKSKLGLGNLGTLAKLGLAAAGAGGVKSLLDSGTGGTGGGGGGSDGFNPVGGYTFDPSKFQATTPDPSMFRPGSEVVTVADAVRRAAQAQGYAEGGQTQSQKPKFTAKAALKAMSPWERASAELNNAAYFARMPTGVAAPQAGIAQLGQFAQGGGISDLGSYSDGGRMLKGGGDGMSDSIPATIGNKRPARLADGEFVIPADVVSGLGNGSTDAGARQLYKMMDRVRQSRTGTKKQGKQINAQKHMPV